MEDDRLAYEIKDRDGFGITTILLTDKLDPWRMYTIQIDTVQEDSFLKGRVRGRYTRTNIDEEVSLVKEEVI